VTEATRAALDGGGDLAAHVTTQAATDTLCAEVLDLFLFCYGAEAGNWALKSLPFGGLFVAGGIAPRLTERLSDANGPFLRGLRTKGRFRGLLESIPVTLLLDPRVGLLGAARAARALCGAA
jgi:glucokinase